MPKKNVKIYLNPDWKGCQKAKEFLLQKDVDLTVHDLSKNPLSNEEILKLMTKEPGVMRGPVIVVDNDKVILGYNRDRLEELIP